MRCCNRQPARLQMRAHQVGKQPVGTLVECRSGFIEQPQGPGTDQQPRQRDAPLLTGGEIAERQMRHAGEPDLVDGLVDRHAFPAFRPLEALPEGQVLRHLELPFHRVAVTEIVAVVGNRQRRAIVSEKRKRTRISAQQPG